MEKQIVIPTGILWRKQIVIPTGIRLLMIAIEELNNKSIVKREKKK